MSRMYSFCLFKGFVHILHVNHWAIFSKVKQFHSCLCFTVCDLAIKVIDMEIDGRYFEDIYKRWDRSGKNEL